MGIGEKIQTLINLRNRNINDVSESINIPSSTLYSIIKRDNNKVDLDVLQSIADELSVTLDYFSTSKISSIQNSFLPNEINHIKKYRNLDGHGKKMVDFTLVEETVRMEQEKANLYDKEDMIKLTYFNDIPFVLGRILFGD